MCRSSQCVRMKLLRGRSQRNRTREIESAGRSLGVQLQFLDVRVPTDFDGAFTAMANEVGSVVLRWEFPGTIQPGQGGVVKFRAKVR